MHREAMRKIAGYALAIAFIFAGWHITAMLVGSPALPEPLPAVRQLIAYGGEILPAFGTSLYRVVIAMFAGTVLAIPLGLVCGRSARLDAVFAPVLYFLYPLPKVVLLPVLIVLMGLADAPKIALIALTIFFQVLVTVRDAAKAVPEDSVESVRSLGAGRLDVYRHVVVPATLPEHLIGHGGRHPVLRRKPRRLDGPRVLHREFLGVARLPAHVRGHHRDGRAGRDPLRAVRRGRAPSDALEEAGVADA